MVNSISKKLVSSIIPERQENSNKSTFGRVLNIAGSSFYPGAAFLSSISALKTGCGYVSLACIKSLIPVIASMVPEITYIPLKENRLGSIDSDNEIKQLLTFNVVSLGCGITTNDSTKSFILNLLPKISDRQKLIIDADGINILAMHKGEINLKDAVITPHPKELSRLLNVSVAEINDNREKYARITSQTYECITVLKGKNTIVTNGDKIYINQTGNSALAKAGTGDVLTGIIAGLLAQKVSSLNAAGAGVYLHGLAGDIASKDLSEYSVMASNIIDYIPFAIRETTIKE